jgi:hypothetical protein
MEVLQCSIHVKYLIMKNTEIAQGGSLSLSLTYFSLSCTQVLETELIDQETLLRIQKIMQSAQAAGSCDSVCARMWVGPGGRGACLRQHILTHAPTATRTHPHSWLPALKSLGGKAPRHTHWPWHIKYLCVWLSVSVFVCVCVCVSMCVHEQHRQSWRTHAGQFRRRVWQSCDEPLQALLSRLLLSLRIDSTCNVAGLR